MTPGDIVTIKTLCSSGVYSSANAPEYALVLVGVQDWDTTAGSEGLAAFLWQNEGATLSFVLNIHTETSSVGTPTQPRMTGTVLCVPGDYGGEIGAYAELNVELPCTAKPTLTTAAVLWRGRGCGGEGEQGGVTEPKITVTGIEEILAVALGVGPTLLVGSSPKRSSSSPRRLRAGSAPRIRISMSIVSPPDRFRPQRHVAGDVGQPSVDRHGIGPRVQAEHRGGAFVSTKQPEQRTDGRRLPGAVRPGTRGPRRDDGEVQTIEGAEPAEVNDQVADRDHGGSALLTMPSMLRVPAPGTAERLRARRGARGGAGVDALEVLR